jgi:DNA repair protein RadC
MKDKLPISKWSIDDRPREKLLKKGVDALSDAELIAILLRSGNKDDSAVELAKKILSAADNNLNELGKFSVEKLLKFNGVGDAKAISIIAALELGRRRNLSMALKSNKITSSQEAFAMLSPVLSDKTTEEFWLLSLKKNLVKNIRNISKGGLDASLVDIRLLMKILLEEEATAFIVAHNHPSGSLVPSQSDKSLTQKIKEASNLLQIQFLDHLIIGNNDYYSFADNLNM